ncbi:MAG: hypothetical protein ACM3ZC_04070 [Bacteroidota bacterium]
MNKVIASYGNLGKPADFYRVYIFKGMGLAPPIKMKKCLYDTRHHDDRIARAGVTRGGKVRDLKNICMMQARYCSLAYTTCLRAGGRSSGRLAETLSAA